MSREREQRRTDSGFDPSMWDPRIQAANEFVEVCFVPLQLAVAEAIELVRSTEAPARDEVLVRTLDGLWFGLTSWMVAELADPGGLGKRFEQLVAARMHALNRSSDASPREYWASLNVTRKMVRNALDGGASPEGVFRAFLEQCHPWFRSDPRGSEDLVRKFHDRLIAGAAVLRRYADVLRGHAERIA